MTDIHELLPIREQLTRIEEKIDVKVRKGWVDLKAACDYCGLSASTIRRYIRSGQLRCSKPSGKLMFKIEWLDKWMEG
jgi:excisionase family DNA binding protein